MIRGLTLCVLLFAFAYACATADGTGQSDRVFIDAETALAVRFGSDWRTRSQEQLSSALIALAESLPVGGAIDLPRSVDCATLDFRRIADGIQVTGGHGGTVIFGGGQRGLELMFSRLSQEIAPGLPRSLDKIDVSYRGRALVSADPKNISVFGEPSAPASDLFALFNQGAIKIKADTKNCAWICGDGAFGAHTVTADARVDDSLFLWFGINWPFADYNQHWNPKNAGRDWVKSNAQLHFNLHGGGQGTRIYEMIETSYGNPGPTAVFENCDGTAIYHGSTERSSSQGPGVYWLHDCHNVQLGLRGINGFSGNNGDPNLSDAARDLTVEGGSGNILHAIRTWSNANEMSIWNNDPALQMWMVCTQYEITGTDNALRFAVTPFSGKPTAEYLKANDPLEKAEKVFKLRELKLKSGGRVKELKNPDTVEQLVEKVKRGRHLDDVPLNATAEETFRVGAADLANGDKPGVKLPAPPRVPPTNAPRTRREIAFTQSPEFGKELLALGADPTGMKPSDDAFSQLMYGMGRDQLQVLIDEAGKLEAESVHLRDERDAKQRPLAKDDKEHRSQIDQDYGPKLKELQARIAANWVRIDGRGGRKKGEKAISRLEIPAGTFSLKRPLYILVPVGSVFGAGPEKTILKTDQAIHAIKMQVPCTIGNFTVEGGTVGLALTGSPHDGEASPVFHSYIYGQNFYNITFRNQSFAGMQIGNDEEGLMGGSEHDQNKYVDLKFIKTGSYGIYFNVGMLDKWLCLHAEFEGQKKAGIAAQFTNLIHGCVIDSSFRNIDGPGIDFFGGNVEIGYRPWQPWIDGCEFIECGSKERFAVEEGIAELSAFTHNKITTKQKTIAGGYAGSAEICEDNVIDVNLIEGAPAIKLRGVRTISVDRANGEVLRDVKANGPLVFANDADQQDALFEKTKKNLAARGRPFVQKWDTNPMAHELAPSNGWVHPFVLYHCEFANQKHGYELLNVDVNSGNVRETIDLSKFE